MNEYGPSDLGKKIRYIRNLKQISQTELAEKLRTRQQVIYNWEKGVRNPKRGTIEKIANALGVPVDLLYMPIYEGDTISSLLIRLAGRNEQTNPQEDLAASRLIQLADRLTPEGQQKLLDLAEMLASHPDYALLSDSKKPK